MTAPAPPKPALPIDPRIRARRVEVIRSEGRRRLRVLIAGVSVLVLVGGGVGVTRSPLLDADHIAIVGAAQTSRADVVAASGLRHHPQMIDIDAARMAGRIRSLPWVRTAQVQRRWPASVRIVLTERRPVAAIAFGSAWALVDRTGRVLSEVKVLPAGLITISGGPDPGPPGRQLDGELADIADLVADLPAEVTPLVTQVFFIDGAIELRGSGASPIVRLGPVTDLPQKIRALQAVVTGADMKRVNVIDVRVPSAPVLTRR